MYYEKLLEEIKNDPNNLLIHPADNRIISSAEFWMLNNVKIFHNIMVACDNLAKTNYPLIIRSFEIPDLSQHDSYIGQVCLASLFSRKYPRDLYNYGKKHFFIYGYNWKYFHQPYQVGYYKVCAGLNMGIINYIWFIGMMLVTARQKPQDTSSKKLVVLMGYRLKQSRWFKWIYNYFEKKMVKQYGTNWYSEILKIYYGENSPLYLFAKEAGR